MPRNGVQLTSEPCRDWRSSSRKTANCSRPQAPNAMPVARRPTPRFVSLARSSTVASATKAAAVARCFSPTRANRR